MTLRSADFRCANGHEHRDVIVDVPSGTGMNGIVIGCAVCGQDARFFWPLGTRMAVRGDENVPRDLLTAAREGNGRDIEPYTGPDSRVAFERWKREQGIVHASTADERQRGAVINSKTKVTKTAAWNARLDQEWAAAEALARSPEGDAYHEAFGAIERPNQHDVTKFREQVGGGVVDTGALAKGTGLSTADPALVAAVAQELKPAV